MCEPKKGVFSRLTRLTRVPLNQDYGGSGDTFITHSTPQNGQRKSPFSPSPTESHRSLMKSPVSICKYTLVHDLFGSIPILKDREQPIYRMVKLKSVNNQKVDMHYVVIFLRKIRYSIV